MNNILTISAWWKLRIILWDSHWSLTLLAIGRLRNGGNVPLNGNSCLCSGSFRRASCGPAQCKISYYLMRYYILNTHVKSVASLVSWLPEAKNIMIMTFVFLSFIFITKENQLTQILCRWDLRQEGTLNPTAVTNLFC